MGRFHRRVTRLGNPPMKPSEGLMWAKLTSQSKARVISRVSRGHTVQEVRSAAWKAQRDLDRDRDYRARQEMARAVAEFTKEEIAGLATKLPAGRAAGSRELNRKRAKAMPMGFWIGT